MNRRACIVGAVALFGLAGCGEVVSSTDGGGGGNFDAATGIDAASASDAALTPDAMVDPCLNPTLAQAHDCMIESACAVLDRCLGINQDICKTLDLFLFDDLPVRVSVRLLPEAITAGHLSYDGAALGQCIQDVAALSCDALFGSSSPFDSCSGFTGLVGDNGACHHVVECASGGYCENWDRNTQCSVGVCRPPVAVGSTCTSNDECIDGAHCTQGVCTSGDPGQTCTGDFECDGTLFCDVSGGTGTCTAKRAANSACTDDNQCSEPLECIGDDLPAGAGTCQKSRDVGDRCDRSFGCSPTFGQTMCVQTTADAEGICQLTPAVGANCDDAPGCRDFALCVDPQMDGTKECVARDTLGQPCTDNSCQTNLFCTSEVNEPTSVCSGPRASGNCSNDDHCESGYCDFMAGTCETVTTCH